MQAPNGESDNTDRIRAVLGEVKKLASEYYQLTKKPLGVTGEVAEYEAARILGLHLADARTPGYDALRGTERIQIKGRALGPDAKPGQRLSRIKKGAPCDVVMLVLLDLATRNAREIWEKPYGAIEKLLDKGGKARERGALSVRRAVHGRLAKFFARVMPPSAATRAENPPHAARALRR
jgi:hypothetical protein